jgi:hypothetical protein
MGKTRAIWHNVVLDEKPLIMTIDLGNATAFRLVSFYHHRRLFVALEHKGAFFFPSESFVHGSYVSEKLNLCEADANIMADWINCQNGYFTQQQGVYFKEYIEEEENTLEHDLLIDFTVLRPKILNETDILSTETEKHGLSKTFYNDH